MKYDIKLGAAESAITTIKSARSLEHILMDITVIQSKFQPIREKVSLLIDHLFLVNDLLILLSKLTVRDATQVRQTISIIQLTLGSCDRDLETARRCLRYFTDKDGKSRKLSRKEQMKVRFFGAEINILPKVIDQCLEYMRMTLELRKFYDGTLDTKESLDQRVNAVEKLSEEMTEREFLMTRYLDNATQISIWGSEALNDMTDTL